MERSKEKYKLSIPDDDLPNWMKVLHEGGLSFEEIDFMFSKLNASYKEQKMKDLVEKGLKELEEKTIANRGRGFTSEEKEYFRESIEEGIRKGTR